MKARSSFGKMVAWLVLISVSLPDQTGLSTKQSTGWSGQIQTVWTQEITFVQKPQTTLSSSLCYMCMPSAAWSQPSSNPAANVKQQPSFAPTLGGALFLCNGLILPPLVSTYQDIWPFPLSAPWQASASPLTLCCLGWEWRKEKTGRGCVNNRCHIANSYQFQSIQPHHTSVRQHLFRNIHKS